MLICGMFVFSAYAQKVFTLKSPSGKLSVTISAGKQLTYDVSCNGRQVVAPSAISMTLDNGEVWGAGARLSGSKTSSVDEMVASPFYRTSEMRDHYNGLVLRFKGGYDVEFRAYDDGIAYRFVSKTKKKFNVGRLVKMHASMMEDISEAGCGEIAALFGIDCASGDTFCDPSLNYSMTSMYVPNPVISLAIKPVDKKAADNMAKALNRFTKEDPTFQTYVDPESNQTIIRGMGELHLDVYIERMKREYKAEVEVGKPEVAYREAISQRAEFNYTHKKQTGGSGQYARVAGYIEPIVQTDPDEPAKDYEFVNEVKGGAIPTEFIPSCDKGFQSAMKKGTQVGFPVIGVRCVVNDGQWHPVDSSDMAFQTAAIGAFREAFEKAKPVILEPIMKVEVEGPAEFQGNIFGSINQRRGMIVSSSEDNNQCKVIAEVPLSEMFGYSTVLRSLTQGKAEFTMEVEKYGRVPQSVSDELKKAYQEKKKEASK